MKKLILALFLIVFFVFSFGMAQARTRDFNNAAGWALVDADNTVSLQDANDVVSLEEQNIINVGEIHLDSIHSDANTTITTPDAFTSSGKITGAGLDAADSNLTDVGEAHLDSIYSDGNTTIPIGDPISVTGKITGSAGLHITADANIVGNLSTTEGITTSSYKNALYYGAAYTDATLLEAITALGSSHWTLVVDRGTWVIDADLTFAANTRLKFEEGAVFDINQSGTDPTDVVINGDLDAGMYQIFDVDANSTISGLDYINAKWFATGDGVTNDTVAMQAAVDDNPQLLYLPEGTFLCNLSVDGAVNIKGEGYKSILKAVTSDPVITVTERLSAVLSGQGSAMGRRFENFTINGNSKTAKGLYYSAATVEEEIVAVYFDNCSRGIDFGTLGAIGNTVRYCNFVTCDYGIYAKDSGSGAISLNLNFISENRFRSIELCGIYLNGSVVAAEGNEFKSNWFEGITGFGVILKGSDIRGHSNRLNGGWFELVAIDSNTTTLDDEGAGQTPYSILLDTVNFISVGGAFPGQSYITDSIVQINRLDGYSVAAAVSQLGMSGSNRIIAKEALFDELGGSVLAGNSTSEFTIEKPRVAAAGTNRGFLVEGLPMVHSVSGHTNLTSLQDFSADSGATITYSEDRFLNSEVIRVELSDNTERILSGTLSLDNDKVYAFSFGIRSSSSSAEDDITFLITGAGTLFNQKTILARGDRWTHYVGVVGGGASVPTSQIIRFGTSADATFDLSRIQLVEFSSITGAEAYIHNQQYCENTYIVTGYGSDTAADDDYLVDLSPALMSYSVGTSVYFDANNANVGPCTLNVNSIGADDIKMLHDQDPPNDYIEEGSIIHVIHDGTNWQIQTPDANP